MGRRIAKSRRHKKIKAIDPFYKGERKNLLDRNAEKRDSKPSNPDEQEIPRKIREIAQSVKLVKEGKLRRKHKKSRNPSEVAYNEGDDYGSDVKGCQRPVQHLPNFKQLPGENETQFLSRIHVASKIALTQSKLEKKFDIVITEDRQGNTEIDTLVDAQNLKVVKKCVSESKKLKRKRLDEKRKAKKKIKLENQMDDFHHLKDEIRFGEVVSQPPSLSVLPKKAASSTVIRKPGAKQLLLKDILGTKEIRDIKQESLFSTKPTCTMDTDLTIKRKHLSVADRRKLDAERQRAVQAYRTLKKRQQMQKVVRPKKENAEN